MTAHGYQMLDATGELSPQRRARRTPPAQLEGATIGLLSISNLDRRGVAGCAVATEAFQPAAPAQARTLGFEPALAWVPHPIRNRTPEELAAIAEAALEDVLKLISA